jgi:DNA-binding response OmpR family regulator
MKKIMIVEDQRLIALDLKLLAINSGFDVITAYSGQSAFKLFESEKPDVILMDIGMETSTAGIDAAKKILAEDHVPIIFLTAYSDLQTLSEINNLDNAGYILKPYGTNEVIKKLNSVDKVGKS